MAKNKGLSPDVAEVPFGHTPAPWNIDAHAGQCIVDGRLKSTPGPWVIERATWNRKLYFHICGFSGPTFDQSNAENADGDARLIAAAPEMLEALQAIQDAFHADVPNEHRAAHIGRAIMSSKTAIAKAKGE
mgnify:FL=1